MSTRISPLSWVVAGAVGSLIASQAFAAGFALNEQSVSAMGNAYAGRAADAQDATTIYSNPAGMSRLKRPEISAGITYIKAKSDISHAQASTPLGPVSGTSKGDFVPDIYIPNAYFATPINDKWAVGLGIYTPFGLKSEYESSFVGRYLARDSEITTVNVQPTVSYKINERWSLGLGVYGSYVDGKLSQNILGGLAGQNTDGYSKVEGDDWGYGYNLGVLYQPTNQTRIGVTYHSKVDYKLEGDITRSGFTTIPTLNGKWKGKLDVTTPESVDIAWVHDLTDRWTLKAGATWTRWSRFKDVTIKSKENIPGAGLVSPTPAGGVYSYTPENWDNSWSYAIGADYKLNPQWTLKAGYAWDQSPIPKENLTARIPSGDRQWLTVGAAYMPTDNITVDMALGYLVEDSVKVNEELHTPSGSGTGITYQGKYDNKAYGAGLQVSYRF